MADTEKLKIELEKLDMRDIARIALLWNFHKKVSRKSTLIKYLLIEMQDIFCIRTVLEKLSSTQTKLYSEMLAQYPEILTLGQLSKVIKMPNKNTEMEVHVLKKYFLIGQKKNRERLTNNFDKCYAFREIADLIGKPNKSQYLSLNPSMEQYFAQHPLPKKLTKHLKITTWPEKHQFSDKKMALLFEKINESEHELLYECINQGGIIEMNHARKIFQTKSLDWEKPVRNLISLGLLFDDHYFLQRPLRLLIMPKEIFTYVQNNPLIFIHTVAKKRSYTPTSKNQLCANDLDFFLNIKKLLLYISKRELSLAKSGKIKQIDFRETEKIFLPININLFVEKSQIHLIELILPILYLLNMVRLKTNQIALKLELDNFISTTPLELMYMICEKLQKKLVPDYKSELVFHPQYMFFPNWNVISGCIECIKKNPKIVWFTVFAILIKKDLNAGNYSDFKDVQLRCSTLRKEITSALFYLQLFGLINVELPNRLLSLSELGEVIFYKKILSRKVEKGALIINPDFSLIAIPEKLSIPALTLLKSFVKIENFENIYTMSLTKESFQEGLLLKESKNELIDLFKNASRQKLSDSLLYELDNWSSIMPVVQITDDCVLVQTKNPENMQLLLGSIKQKNMILEVLSENAITIQSGKIGELIAYCERLHLIVKLTK